MLHSLPAAGRAYHFPLAISLSMSMSKTNSATSFLSLLFSFSSSFRRFAWSSAAGFVQRSYADLELERRL